MGNDELIRRVNQPTAPEESAGLNDASVTRIVDHRCTQLESALQEKIDIAVSCLREQLNELKELLVCSNNDALVWMVAFPPYAGKTDVRSPVDFLRELEQNLKSETSDEAKAKALRHVLSKSSHTSWIRLMDDSASYDAVKKEFLRRHWDAKAQEEAIADFLSYDLGEHRPENFQDYFLSWKRRLQAAVKNDVIVPALVKIFADNAPDAVQSALHEGQPKTLDDVGNIVEKMPLEALKYDPAAYPPAQPMKDVYSKLFKETYVSCLNP